MGNQLSDPVFAQKVYDRISQLINSGIKKCKEHDYDGALFSFQEALDAATQASMRKAQGSIYGNLGMVYKHKGNLSKSLEYHQKHLEVAMELQDKPLQIKALFNIGDGYLRYGRVDNAIDFYKKGLAISTNLGDRAGESNAYMHLGIATFENSEYQTAIDYHLKHLMLAADEDNVVAQGYAFGHLGACYFHLGEYEKAENFFNKRLKIAEQTDIAAIGRCYGNLALCHHQLGRYEQAIELHMKHVKLAVDLEDVISEGRIYDHLARTFEQVEPKRALQFQIRAVELLTPPKRASYRPRSISNNDTAPSHPQPKRTRSMTTFLSNSEPQPSISELIPSPLPPRPSKNTPLSASMSEASAASAFTPRMREELHERFRIRSLFSSHSWSKEESSFNANLACIYIKEQKYEEAIDHCASRIALSSRTIDSLGVIRSLANECYALIKMGKHSEAKKKFDHLEQAFQKLKSEDQKGEKEPESQSLRLDSMKKQFKEIEESVSALSGVLCNSHDK